MVERNSNIEIKIIIEDNWYKNCLGLPFTVKNYSNILYEVVNKNNNLLKHLIYKNHCKIVNQSNKNDNNTNLLHEYDSLNKIYNDLIEAFILREYQLIYPQISITFKSKAIAHYHNDVIFNKRVKYIISEILQIVSKHISI